MPTTVEGWADRLARFGNAIPQEKVFVHMDNTCYFLGDTIWYKAYTRRTDQDVPSNVSRVLYAELYNQDGYLVERQILRMQHGEGHGNFVLTDTLYGGFYELRAYTRWQLNWGQTQHPHTKYAEEWFFNRAMAREYYRDYEKLYSRVFPVYSKPKTPGEYTHDMTIRPLRRVYKENDKTELMLNCYPEGGQLVAGVACRMAFEVTTMEGEWQEGTLTLLNADGATVAEAPAVNRGRGLVCFTPEKNATYTARFTTKDNRSIDVKIKAAAADGVALNVIRQDDQWLFTVNAQGTPAAQPLGMTIMHEGVTTRFSAIPAAASTFTLIERLKEEGSGEGTLVPGVNQVTVFDANGRVWADRLFFVSAPHLTEPTLTISGMKKQYAPYEEVSLKVTAQPGLVVQADQEQRPLLSVAVRDASTQDYLYDSGNIMTEMLLASEIRGFVPQPEYFFEADDETHRTALDLLMLTQGWRRFDWHAMATPGAFELFHPAEYTPVLSGIVHNYTAHTKDDEVRDQVLAEHQAFMEEDNGTLEELWAAEEEAHEAGGNANESAYDELLSSMSSFQSTQGQSIDGIASSRFLADEGRLKREVLVHAEFVQPGDRNGIEGDAVTTKGRFRMQIPDFEGYCLLFLGASDTTKWKKDERHMWVDMNEENYPEYYVRLSFPYPRFVKPYGFYHTNYPAAPEGSVQTFDFQPDDGTMMNTVTVRARRRGLRAFDASKPAFVLDAMEAFNQVVDAGLSVAWYQGYKNFVINVARTYIGDMNMERNYRIDYRFNARDDSYYHTPGILNAYNNLYNLDKVYVYTDYSPRREGSTAFDQDNQPSVSVDLRRPADEGMRVTYRDRYYALQGFNVADDFYQPDYRRHPLPDGEKDYRRTLYWNPALQLDGNGAADISFFTGSRPAILSVEANGQTADGILLTGQKDPGKE